MKTSAIQMRMVMALLGVVLFTGLYGVLFFKIRNINTNISTVQNQLDIEVRRDQQLRSIKQLLSELHVEVATIDGYFVAKDGVVGFLEEVESLGRLSGVTVKVNSVSVDGGDTVSPYEQLHIEFFAEQRWSSLMQFISLLETLPLGVTIERSQIERVPNSNSWQVHITFTVLKLK